LGVINYAKLSKNRPKDTPLLKELCSTRQRKNHNSFAILIFVITL
jgi:hypothetical protein